MSLPQAVRAALSQYATFAGRARPSECWWFYLFTLLAFQVAGLLDRALTTAWENNPGVVSLITSLVLLLPALAVTARRLHDTGRSGWWMLLPVPPALLAVPLGIATSATLIDGLEKSGTVLAYLTLIPVLCTLAAGIVLVVFLSQDSHPWENRFGRSSNQPAGYGAPRSQPLAPPTVPSGFSPPQP